MYYHTKNLNIDFESIRDEFKEKGFILIKSFFPPKFIHSLQTKIMELLVSNNWGKIQENRVIPNSQQVNKIASEEFFNLIEKIMAEESLHELSLYQDLRNLIDGLLNTKSYPHPRKMVRLSYPFELNPDDLIPAHQDVAYVKGELDTLTVWIPLGNYSKNDGGLKVVPGSHKLKLLPTKDNDDESFKCTVCELGKNKLNWQYFEYELGDVLIMHSLLVHASGENLSNHFRLSVDCRYSAVNGSINKDQLLPPYYPNITNWDKLSKNWKQNLFKEIPSTLLLKENTQSLEEILAKGSIFL